MKIRINNDYQKLIFPLPKMEYQELKESIKENGLWHPITINKDGYVLDGHHRFKACQELGIEPAKTIKEFDNILYEKLFVIDSNLKRRHLNTFQRTELALNKKPILEAIAKQRMLKGKKADPSQKSDKGRVDEQIAKDAMTSRDTIRKVQTILEKADKDDLTKARIGEKKINEVYKNIITTENKSWRESLPQKVKDARKHHSLVQNIYGFAMGLTELITGYNGDKILRLNDNFKLISETKKFRFDLTKRLHELDLDAVCIELRRLTMITNDFLKQIDDEKESRRNKKALTSE